MASNNASKHGKLADAEVKLVKLFHIFPILPALLPCSFQFFSSSRLELLCARARWKKFFSLAWTDDVYDFSRCIFAMTRSRPEHNVPLTKQSVDEHLHLSTLPCDETLVAPGCSGGLTRVLRCSLLHMCYA